MPEAVRKHGFTPVSLDVGGISLVLDPGKWKEIPQEATEQLPGSMKRIGISGGARHLWKNSLPDWQRTLSGRGGWKYPLPCAASLAGIPGRGQGTYAADADPILIPGSADPN